MKNEVCDVSMCRKVVELEIHFIACRQWGQSPCKSSNWSVQLALAMAARYVTYIDTV